MPKNDSNAEELVSVDDDETLEPLDIAVDERKLVTQPYDYSVDQLAAHVAKGKILLMEVEYQREYVWDDAKASRLIESLLLNVPIPVCYFAENSDGSWEVIDGLQRVHSITRYLRDEFALRGLTVLVELNAKKFADLPTRDRRRIESRTMRFVVITEDSHPDIKFDVFERLNTGSVMLVPQELRNCIYRGIYNNAVKKLALNADFHAALGKAKDQRMRDEELVLRFLALFDGIRGYKPPLTQFLNEHIRVNRKKEPTAKAVKAFKESMKTIKAVFGNSAFRMLRDGSATANLNRALYDAVAISISFSDQDSVVANSDAVLHGHRKLLANREFMPLVGRATADRSRMYGRVRMYSEMLVKAGVKTKVPNLIEE